MTSNELFCLHVVFQIRTVRICGRGRKTCTGSTVSKATEALSTAALGYARTLLTAREWTGISRTPTVGSTLTLLFLPAINRTSRSFRGTAMISCQRQVRHTRRTNDSRKETLTQINRLHVTRNK